MKLPVVAPTQPTRLTLHIGPLQISILHPDSQFLHVFSLKLAEIKTSQPSPDTLQLIASSLSLESASFVNEEGNNNNPTQINNTLLSPTNITVDTQFEVNGKTSVSAVVEAVLLVVSKNTYKKLLELSNWSTSLLPKMYELILFDSRYKLICL